MATLHRDGESRVIYVKGALEKVLARSARHADGRPFDAESRERIEEQAHDMASEGLRVLAFASRRVPSSVDEIAHADVESDLVFIGLQGMIDPPEPRPSTPSGPARRRESKSR